jgi:hypothetical protein
MQPAFVEFDLGFFPLMWILFFVTPSLSVNGLVHRLPWGKHPMQLAPGRYMFQAWYPYLFTSQTSMGQLMLDLMPGASYRIKYRPAWLVFLGGSMTVEPMQMLPPGQQMPGPPPQY